MKKLWLWGLIMGILLTVGCAGGLEDQGLGHEDQDGEVMTSAGNLLELPKVEEGFSKNEEEAFPVPLLWYGEGFDFPEDKINALEEVTIALDEVNPTSYVLYNNYQETIWYGGNMLLEKQTEDGFAWMEPMAEAPAILLFLEPGEETIHYIRPITEEGTYRLTLAFSGTTENAFGQEEPRDEEYYIRRIFEVKK